MGFSSGLYGGRKIIFIVKTLNKFYNKKMAYDEKYKLRTLSYKNEGHTLSQTSAIFQISITTIRKWEKQLKEEGNLKRHTIPRRFKKIEPEKLRAYVKENPDAYLREIAEVFQCCQTAIRKALIRLKITRKKRLRAITSKNLKK